MADRLAAVEAEVDPVGVVTGPAHPDDVEATLADTVLCRRLVGFVLRTDLRALVGRQAKSTDEEVA